MLLGFAVESEIPGGKILVGLQLESQQEVQFKISTSQTFPGFSEGSEIPGSQNLASIPTLMNLTKRTAVRYKKFLTSSKQETNKLCNQALVKFWFAWYVTATLRTMYSQVC